MEYSGWEAKVEKQDPMAGISQMAQDEDLAFRLLRLEQRLDAWDRLYNEEVGELKRELHELAAEFTQMQAEEKLRRTLKQRKQRSTGK
jgi:hypothetical protein